MSNFKEFLSANLRLVVAVSLATLGLVAMQLYIKAGSDECLGVADSKETMVSFETPVIVKRIFVLPGQEVKKGQPLVEVVPAEVNLKLLEVRTELESLESELKMRNMLLGTLRSKGKQLDDNSPLSQSIAGFRKQAQELMRQQALAIRYAEEDGVVATVAYRPREQVQPFLPIITLTPHKPDLVYGFIHENRASQFRVGDFVTIQPVADRQRETTGRIVSVGSRITPFPDRFQLVATRPNYFGRELVIRLPEENSILIGEKVRVAGAVESRHVEFDFLSVADASATFNNTKVQSQLIRKDLQLEASGALWIEAERSLLVVSDDNGPNGSPFWMVPLDPNLDAVNLPMTGIAELDDVESVTQGENGFYYASTSLSHGKKNNVIPARQLVVRFKIQNNQVIVDRSLNLRDPLLEVIKSESLLQPLMGRLDKMDVEAFTIFKNDAYLALKEPQMDDGSSVVLKISNLVTQIEANQIPSLNAEVFAMIRLEHPSCNAPSRITDMLKTEDQLIMLSNCKKKIGVGQVWSLTDKVQSPVPNLMFTVQNGQPEGLAFGGDRNTFYVTSDNGNKKGSDILKVQIPR